MCVKGAAKRPRKKIEISKRAVDGSITLYLALTLAVTLSLYTVLILGARIGAARMQTESVCRIAQNASLAEFHRELHSRYDLFMTDTSYGGAGGGNEVFAQHLRGYMEKNCERRAAGLFGVSRDWTSLKIIDAQVTDARYACDNNGRAVREQVYAYMAADPAGSVIADLLVSADRWKGLEISGREWTTRTDENSEELKQALRNGREEQREENERKEHDPHHSGTSQSVLPVPFEHITEINEAEQAPGGENQVRLRRKGTCSKESGKEEIHDHQQGKDDARNPHGGVELSALFPGNESCRERSISICDRRADRVDVHDPPDCRAPEKWDGKGTHDQEQNRIFRSKMFPDDRKPGRKQITLRHRIQKPAGSDHISDQGSQHRAQNRDAEYDRAGGTENLLHRIKHGQTFCPA